MKKDIHLESLVPDLISENIYFNNPKFRQLIEAFLRYLEQRNESTLYINKLVDLRNVDEVLMDFINHLEYELGPSIPANNIGDKALYLKRLKELYISRGTTSSIEAFFKLFYNTLIEIEFPFESVLIPSSGNFDEVQYTNQVVVESQDFSSIQRASDTAVYRVDRDTSISQFYNINSNLELVTALSLEGYVDLRGYIGFTMVDFDNIGDYQNTSIEIGDYVYEGNPYYYAQTNPSDDSFFEVTKKTQVGQEVELFASTPPSQYFYLTDYTDSNTPGYALIIKSIFFQQWDDWISQYGAGKVSLKHKLYKRTDEIIFNYQDTSSSYVEYEEKEFDLVQVGPLEDLSYTFSDTYVYYTFYVEDEDGVQYTEGVTGTDGTSINIKPKPKTPRVLYLRVNELTESQFKKKLNIVTSDNYEFPAIPYDPLNFDIDTARLYVNDKFLPRVEDRTVNWTYDYKAISGFPGGSNVAFAAEPRLNIQFATNKPQEELLYTHTVVVNAASVLDGDYYSGTFETPFHTISYGSIYSVSVNGLELTFDNAQPAGDNSWRADTTNGEPAESFKDIGFKVLAADVDPTENLTFEIVVVGRIELFYPNPNTLTNNFNNYIYNFDALSSDSIIKIGDTTLEKGREYTTIYREVTRAKQFEFKEKAYAAKFYKIPGSIYDSDTETYTVEISTPFLIADPEHIIRIEIERTDSDGITDFIEIDYNSTIGTNDSWGFDPSVAENRDKIFMTLSSSTIDPDTTVQDYGEINVTIVYYSEYGEVIEFIQNDPNNRIDLVNGRIESEGNETLTITKKIPAYLDNKGFLSDNTIVLQDSYKYQLFSYILKTSINPTLWDNAYKQLINPAGFLYFTEVLLIVYGIEGLLESGKLLPDFQPGSQQGDIDFVILIPDFNANANAVPEKFVYKTYVDQSSYSGDTGFLYANSNLIGPYDYFDSGKFTSFSGIGEFSNYTIQDAINNNIDVNSLSEITFS